jgi:branched-chain amino acid transport system substrate-binding protein
MKKLSLLVLISLVLLAACGSGLGDEIKMGYIGGASGFAAAFGVPAQEGVQFAIDEINEAGGINGRQITLVALDDKGDPLESIQSAKRLVEAEKVDVIVTGSSSSATLAHMEVTREEGPIEITPLGSDPDITGSGHQYMFVDIINNDLFGQSAAAYAVKDMGLSKIAVMIRDDAYGTSIGEAFVERAKELGAEIVYEKEYPIDTQNFQPLLLEVQNANPDAIMLTGYASDGGLIAKQARELAIDLPFVATNPIMSPQYRDIAGSAADNTFISAAYVPAAMAGLDAPQEFIQKWTEAKGTEPNVYQAHAYDCVMLLAKAIESAKSTDPEKLRAELLEVNDYPGASGVTSFNSDGSVLKPAIIVKIEGGEVVYLKTLQPPF